jgi:hypothetical protein
VDHNNLMRILEECIYCQVIEKITTNPGQLLGSLVYAFVAEYIDIADMNLVILMVDVNRGRKWGSIGPLRISVTTIKGPGSIVKSLANQPCPSSIACNYKGAPHYNLCGDFANCRRISS